MKMCMCAVFDSVVSAYMQPFWAKTHGEAMRGFGDACQDDKMPFKGHPSDYTLFAFGVFDDNTGAFEAYTAPQRLLGASECIQSK